VTGPVRGLVIGKGNLAISGRLQLKTGGSRIEMTESTTNGRQCLDSPARSRPGHAPSSSQTGGGHVIVGGLRNNMISGEAIPPATHPAAFSNGQDGSE